MAKNSVKYNDLIFKTHESVLRLEGKVDSIVSHLSVIDTRLNSHSADIEKLSGNCIAAEAHRQHILDDLKGIKDDAKHGARNTSISFSTGISITVAAIQTFLRWLGL